MNVGIKGNSADVQMADLELFYFDQDGSWPDFTNSLPWSSNYGHVNKKALGNEYNCEFVNCKIACANSGQWTAAPLNGHIGTINQGRTNDEITVCCVEEIETSFTRQTGDVSLKTVDETSLQQLARSNDGSHRSSSESVPELSILSDDDLTSEVSGKSADYGFISAVTCLVTGISLVAISYTIPRDVKINPESVSAREMEKLEKDNAMVGAHLDRCVIAGLCLLTLGGVVLSTLLMVSMWKGEMFKRRALAYSKHSAKLYGSINLRGGASPSRLPSNLSVENEDLEVVLT